MMYARTIATAALSVVAGLISGCASAPKSEARPLSCVLRMQPKTAVRGGGCWAQYTVNEQTGYFLFFAPDRPAPDLTAYTKELEAGAFTPVLRNADFYVGSPVDFPFPFLFGGHSYCDRAFANTAEK